MSKRTAGNNRSASGAGNYVFINISLDKAQKTELGEIVASKRYSLPDLFVLVEEGYKVSINRDEKNGSFICSVTDQRGESETHRHILTGRGATAINAIVSVLYKHHVICSGDWLPYVSIRDSNDSDFG